MSWLRLVPENAAVLFVNRLQLGMLSNNALQRTNGHRGRAVLAMKGVLGGAEWAVWLAAEQDR